jgi:hypothetical protein
VCFLGCSSRPVQNFFPHCTLFQFLFAHRLESWQAAMLSRRLLVCVSVDYLFSGGGGHSESLPTFLKAENKKAMRQHSPNSAESWDLNLRKVCKEVDFSPI